MGVLNITIRPVARLLHIHLVMSTRLLIPHLIPDALQVRLLLRILRMQRVRYDG